MLTSTLVATLLSVLRLGLLVTGILIARAKAPKGSTLRFYLNVQLVGSLINEAVYILTDRGVIRDPHLYPAIYISVQLWVFASMLIMVYSHTIDNASLRVLSGIVISLGMCTTTLIAIERNLDFNEAVTLIEGGMLASCGAALALASYNNSLLRTLTLLWLGLAGFNFSYILTPIPVLNQFLPTLMCFAAFLWIGLSSPRLKRPAQPRHW